MNEIAEAMVDELDPYVIPDSYPPKYNPRKVADYCKEMGIEDPSTLTKEQLEPFKLKKPADWKPIMDVLSPVYADNG